MFAFLRSTSFYAPNHRFRSVVPVIHLTWRDLFWMFFICLIVLLIAALPARAGNTDFLTGRNASITFPMSPPNRANSTPGAIDNMTIGATTPAPGTFSTLKSSDGLTCATYAPSGTPAATDAVFFLATRPYILVSVSEVHSVVAGGASVLQVVKDTGTNAPGAGTDLLTNNTNTGFDLNAAANTPQVGTLVAVGTRTLAAGDRLSVDYANAIQSSAGVTVTACMAPK